MGGGSGSVPEPTANNLIAPEVVGCHVVTQPALGPTEAMAAPAASR